MRFVADFHIHSHYSISTSRELTPEHLDLWARHKGIAVVGTGDATHPGWLQELKAKLEPAEEGLYRLRADLRLPGFADRDFFPAAPEERKPAFPRFLLSAEVSTIYRREGRTRKVHHLILLPSFAAAEALQRRLSRIGNLGADGRPVLGLDSRDLLEIALEQETFFVPAHIWTPWFSALGDKSGFDSIAECYRDLAAHIYAVETGLSSDPPMNWLCSFLDRYALVSNSDAHSPEKLGREANLFDAVLSYPAILEALRAGGRAEGAAGEQAPGSRFLGTIEFFPQEGKYHYDGHRRCGVCWEPGETLKHGGLCPQCGKPVTVGVLNRVAQLADRARPRGGLAFHSLIPLKEILAELAGTGVQSREIQRRYEELIRLTGSELALLLELPVAEVGRLGGEAMGEAVRRMRAGEVHIEPGYDGEYGRITLFKPGEAKDLGPQELLFEEPATEKRRSAAAGARIGADLERFRSLKREAAPPQEQATAAQKPALASVRVGINAEQRRAVEHGEGPALILAGPGTGKTQTLAERIVHLIRERGEPPEQILAVTFTNKAAREMRERLLGRLGAEPLKSLRVCTFHAFGLSLLKEHGDRLGRSWPFSILDEEEREQLLAGLAACPKGRSGSMAEELSAAKRALRSAQELPNPTAELFQQYEKALAEQNAVDLDDLIRLPVRLLEANPDLLENLRACIRWLLIDEYQDIDAAQYRLVRLLMGDPQSRLFAIGDPDQAIYGFRGADVRFIRRFREDYPRAAVYALSTSYRCSATILQASAQVLAAPEDRFALEGLEPGVRIRIGEHPSEASEAEFVARTIERMIGGVRFFSLDSAISRGEKEEGIAGLADFAVLCRVGRQMDALEKAFADHSLPSQKVGETPWFKQEPARSVLCVLKALRNPDNRLARERALLCVAAENLELWRRRLAQGVSLPGLIEAISSALPARGGEGQEAVRRLAGLAEEWGEEVDRFLEQAILGFGPDAFRSGAEAVALLTLHAAKGLEFPCVFIVGCEDGLLPYCLHEGRAADPAEERRLFYVGMTRAKRYLYLTHARKRFLFGREYRLPRSPFLDAIEEELAERSRLEPKVSKKTDEQLRLF